MNYAFTAPPPQPAIKKLWRAENSTITGTVTRTDAASRMDQEYIAVSPISVAMPALSVMLSDDHIKTEANKYSFQAT